MGRDAINPLNRFISKEVKESIIPSTKDGKEDINLKVNDVITSPHGEFVVLEFLGAGAFGKVIKCRHAETNEFFAVKMLRSNSASSKEGDKEIEILKELGENNAGEHNIVLFYETFTHLSHKSLVFEALEISLRDYINNILRRRHDINSIRNIINQLLKALVKLSSHGIVHTDLKPENIMIVDIKESRHRVKVIDFGGAFHLRDRNTCTPYLGSRWYRAPEVILGLPISTALDIWSLGCIVAELFMGSPLYPGATQFEMLRLITEAQGILLGTILSTAPRAAKFFTRSAVAGSSIPVWSLKAEEKPTLNKRRRYTVNLWCTLEKLNIPEGLSLHELKAETEEREHFVEMLRSLLDLEPKRRISAQTALSHAFMTYVPLSEADRSKQSPPVLTSAPVPSGVSTIVPLPRRARMSIRGTHPRARKENPVPLTQHNNLAINNLIPSQSITPAPDAVEGGSRKRKCESVIDISPMCPPEKKKKTAQTARKTSRAYNTCNKHKEN